MSVLLSLLLFLSVHLAASVLIPPKIIRQSPEDIFYKPGETVKMECLASGNPQPSYFWRRAEMAFAPEGNDDRIVKQKDAGTIIINSPEDKDQGIYQCFATNSQGTASTIKFNLKMAKLDEFTTSNPIHHTTEPGNPVTMNCQSPDSVPDAQIYWVYNNNGALEPVYWDSRVTMDYEDRLYFTHVTVEDKNNNPYYCVAYNNIMRMSVIGPPQYIDVQGTSLLTSPMAKLWPKSRFDEQGLVGSDFKMKCIFSGNPPPTVSWKRKDNQPFNDRVLLGNSGGQELVIRDLRFEDAGTYLCDSFREQESSVLEMSVNLNVNSRPSWKSKPRDVIVAENGTAEFECLADGVPKPQIFWFVNGEPLETALKNDKRLDRRFHHLTEEKVMLEQVTKQDTMVFQCNVTNLHGYIWAEAFLNVLSEAPTILKPPNSMKVAEGQPFEIACEVTGKPDPIITWYWNNQHVTGGRFIINETGSLHVQTAVLSDAGEFRCEAHNVYGIVDALATLIVRRKTVIEWMPMDLEVQRGVNAKFTCSGTTDPEETTKLTTSWLKDGDLVDLGNRMFLNLQDHSLTISGSEQRDTGTYTCVVSNGLDSDSASARLVVTDIPDAPYDVKIKDSKCLSDKTAELNWIAGSFNNAPIQFFVIEYMTRIDSNRWVFAAHVDYRKDTALIMLDPGMDYSFRVTASNKIGSSNPSIPTNTTCVTKSGIPSQNPRNVRTIGDKRGMLHIVWTPVPPEHQGGSNFTYIITIQRVGDNDNVVFTKKILDWRVYEFLYDTTGLDYTRYKITVRSRNNEGDSGEALPIVYGYSSEGAPRISPTNLNVADIQSDNALFSWQFDSNEIGKVDSNIQGEFRGFMIQFWEQGNQAETIREYEVSPEMLLTNSAASTFSTRVPYLTPNTRLQARVAVLNNFFVSKPSDVFSFVTLPGLPGPVELLRDLNVGDNHVNLQWRVPLDNRGDIIGYDIGYQEVNGLHVGQMQDRMPQIDDPYATTAMLSGLLPNTNYRIHIWARTVGGRGEDFFIERRTTYPGVPLIPRFTISSVGTNYINITWWRDAYQGSGSIVYIEYMKEDGAEWFSTTPDVSKDWVRLGFLEAGTKYNVRLVVTNGETTRLSQIEDVTTDGTAKAYDVVANLGWFLGMVFSVVLEIVLVTVFVICYRKGFRFNTGKQEIRTYKDGSETYTGTHYNKEEIQSASNDFGPEPGGYSNDMYKNGYNEEYEDDDVDGMNQYDDGSNKYREWDNKARDSSHYGKRSKDDYRRGQGSQQDDDGTMSHDYEDYSVGEPRDTSFNKSDHSDAYSFAQPVADSSEVKGRRNRYQDESHRDKRMDAQREAHSMDNNDVDQYSDRRQQTDKRRQKDDVPFGRRETRTDPENSRRRDDQQRNGRRQDSRHRDDFDDRHPFEHEQYNRQESRYNDDYDARHADARKQNNRQKGLHNDNFDDQNDDDRHYRHYRRDHSHPNHDHEKCDDVVEEFKRHSAAPSRHDSSDNSQGHSTNV